MAQPTKVFILTETPTNERMPESLPSTTWHVSAFDIEGTIDDTVDAHRNDFPLGSVLYVTTDAWCDAYEVAGSLVPRDG